MEGTHSSIQIPAILPGSLYTREQVLHNLKVSGKTLARWEARGLKSCQPATRQVFYFADDLLAIMRLDRGEFFPEPKPEE